MASLEEFLLASFPLPSSTVTPSPPTISAVAYPLQPKQDGRLCVATPHSGIALYDLADQTPLSSITLGPSFQPTTSAVSRSIPSSAADSIRVKGVRNTWVGVKADDDKGEIWNWTEEERKDGSTEGEPSKIVYPTSAPISALLAPRTLPNHLLLLAATGSLALATSENLSIVASLGTSSGTPISQSLHTFPIHSTTSFLPPSITSLLPTRKGAHLVLIVRKYALPKESSPSLVEIGKKKFKKTKRPSSAMVIDEAEAKGADVQGKQDESRSEIEIVLLDPEVEIEDEMEAQPKMVSLGTVKVAGEQVVVSESGFVSTLGANGVLSSFRLTYPSALATTTYADLFLSPVESNLTLSPIKTFPLSTTSLTSTSTQILALHSSFILLASIRPASLTSTSDDSAPQVTALLWDVRLGAVISHSTIPVPSAVTPSRTNLSLSLSSANSTHATLALSPLSTSTAGRIALFALPLSTLPSASVLAAVVGKHALTKQWLQSEETVLDLARKAEPIRHPRTSKNKEVLLDASEKAREAIIVRLAALLTEGKEDVEGAEKAFAEFIGGEKKRLDEYNVAKVQAANEKEKERRVAALKEKDELRTSTKKYQVAKRRIEEVIQAAEGSSSWNEVTGKRIKGVSDMYRYKYYDTRKALEEEMGQIVVDKSLEKAMEAIQKQEPIIPSAFVTAVLRLCFPSPSNTSTDLVVAGSSAPSTSSRKHPVAIVSYFLERSLVGDGQIEGGLTRHLAKAGDWINIQKALETMPDIPESTTVSLLKLVVLAASPSPSSSTSLPQPAPPLSIFLTSFVESPCTPSTLRTAFQSQLTAVEVLPVLKVLDDWLSWWAKRGGGGGQLDEGRKDWKSEGGRKPKRLPTNPFLALVGGEEKEEGRTPPRVEDIVPLVQAILDAHFVTLLLQRSSHSLLRRLSSHVASHVALSTDLSSLLGALSIYTRAKEDMKAEARKTAQLAQENEYAAATGAKQLGQSMAARVKAQEKHNEVGEYAVDQFYL
ncbi:hypothetical protein BCR35DRAFT_299835 [Leucosporidium creatinivorum]|uniref:Uncharacterized protein n=1 Tax=Leucosporidium creatinivorum TaxID=106004 RepID=A0A1Y2G0T3_9BASI|nr:hypothetical protein BCR35DRAFT_299835 [Leucosporidium creatinivorum]